MHTVPTGFSGVPPVGPATPVIAREALDPSRLATPRAIASATGSLTAPVSSSSRRGTPRTFSFTSSSYATTPPAKTAEEPGIAVRRSPMRPPVHDSATANR